MFPFFVCSPNVSDDKFLLLWQLFTQQKEESAILVVFWDGRYIWLEAIKAFDLNDAV